MNTGNHVSEKANHYNDIKGPDSVSLEHIIYYIYEFIIKRILGNLKNELEVTMR